MLGIGWLMFWKALIVSAGVAALDAWALFKRRRIEKGIPLKFKDGVYRPSNWPERAERITRFAFWSIFVVLNLLAALVVFLFLMG